MSDEELLAPPGVSAGTAAWRLRERLAADGMKLLDGERSELVRAYLDTFDGRLGAAGLAVTHSRGVDQPPPGRLAVVDRDSCEERAGEDLPAPQGPLLAIELAPGPLREALLAIVDVRALLPLVELRSELAEYRLLDEVGKTVARIVLERPSLSSGAREELRPRLRLRALRGYHREAAHIAELARELGFTPARRPLLEDAVLATGGSPGGVSAKVAVELLPSQRSDAAAAAVLRRLAAVVEANLEGTIDDVDAEFLHDLRVAVRRSRAVQRELRGVFEPERLQHFRAEFKWLQGITGASRDLDVYVLEFDQMRALLPEPMRDDLGPLLRVLREQRERARRTMATDLRSERMTRLRREWVVFLERLVGSPTDSRPDAQVAIAELAGARIRKVYRRMRKMGEAIDESSPSEDYHEIRKQGKELRYLLELFGTPLFPEDVVKPMIKTLKSLQDVLGRHQDREVQRARMHELAEPVAALPGRAAALMAMGVMVERLHEDELAARGEFAERFAAFTSPTLRKLVKGTFR